MVRRRRKLPHAPPFRSHFDLGYALVGLYEEMDSGRVNELPRLHGRRDATDADGMAYLGLGAGGGFGAGIAVWIIRFIPTAQQHRVCPAPGPPTLDARNRGKTVLHVSVDVPPPLDRTN